jgi:hypothetical protein
MINVDLVMKFEFFFVFLFLLSLVSAQNISINESEINLTDFNLSVEDIKDVNLTEVNLSEINFSALGFDDIDLDRIDFSDIDLEEVDLDRIDLENPDVGDIFLATIGAGDISCEMVLLFVGDDYSNISINDKIPFDDDIFDVYVDGDFMVSIELKEKEISNMACEVSDFSTYDVYLDKSVVEAFIDDEIGEDVIGFYNENRKDGDIEIEGKTFFRKAKIGVINFGLRVAGWFG